MYEKRWKELKGYERHGLLFYFFSFCGNDRRGQLEVVFIFRRDHSNLYPLGVSQGDRGQGSQSKFES